MVVQKSLVTDTRSETRSRTSLLSKSGVSSNVRCSLHPPSSQFPLRPKRGYFVDFSFGFCMNSVSYLERPVPSVLLLDTPYSVVSEILLQL